MDIERSDGIRAWDRPDQGRRRRMRLRIVPIAAALVAAFLGAQPGLTGSRLAAQDTTQVPVPADSSTPSVQTQPASLIAPADTTGATSAPVVVGVDTLWIVRLPLGPFSPAERAAASARKIDSLLALPTAASQAIRSVTGALGPEVMFGDVSVATVTDADASVAGVPAAVLADSLALLISAAQATGPATLSDFARGLLYTALATLALMAALAVIRWLFPRMYALADPTSSRWIRPIRIQRLELVSAQRIGEVLTAAFRVLRFVVTAGALYFFVPLVLSFFPLTAGIADQLVTWVMGPLGQAWGAFVAYLPNVFRIAVIGGVMYYALRLVNMIFDGVRFGRIRIPGFYQDWARPTYQIVRFLLIALGAVVIWPYLPMSGSPGFRGIAAFLGLLLSLGSASAIANVVGGVVLIYMRSFQVGDRVRIADTVGDVIEKGLLVTRIRTPKNVNVTIPNSMVLGDHLTNYSRAAKDEGVILHTTVTIGYDVPWTLVHETLKSAAVDVDGVLTEPEPFVLQTSLDDFYVAYELNVYSDEPRKMSAIYSDLHRNIQDACNAADIEILSPHFRGLRDGNAPQIPTKHRDPAARVPAFRVEEVPTTD